ncbi:hypothetical protein JCM10908_000901 [Rhodotorula pacifica]|uniref:Sto1p n=1 Tax=Rhodotorula pacifica TaxID=1495444 RepID=UPI00317C48F1
MSNYGYSPAGGQGNYGGGGRNDGYNGGGGGYNGGYGSPSGGYGRGGYGGGRGSGKKRARNDDDSHGQNFRRRHNERGDYNASPRRGGYGGGGRGGRGGDYHQQGGPAYDRVPSHEAMKNRFKEELWTLGNDASYDPAIDIPSMAQSIESWFFRDRNLVFLAFRSAGSEMPHKIPHYAALLARLSVNAVTPPVSLASRIGGPSKFTPAAGQSPPRGAAPAEPKEEADANGAAEAEEAKPAAAPEPEKVNVGHAIVQDLAKAFQAFLDERRWKSVRYSVILFATLTTMPSSAPVVTLSSLISLLNSFVSMLDEPGLKATRGDECVRIVIEALLRLDSVALSEPGVELLREGVETYISSRRIEKELFADGENQAQWLDPLEHLVASFRSLGAADAPELNPVAEVIPDVYSALTLAPPAEDEDGNVAHVESLTLPVILVPPESDEDDLTLGAANGVERAIPAPPISAGLRGDEGVGYDGVRLLLRLFDDETVPAVDDAAGVVIRSIVHDVISLYEVNRKDAATLLLELPRWFKKGTFRDPKPVKRPAEDDEDMQEEPELIGPQWSLETIVVETLIVLILALPAPSHTLVYYYSVLTELCRISPTTVAPSLGKSVRKLYAALGTSGEDESAGAPVLDAEGVRRFADWFAVHLSNYGFMWGWNDWAADMDDSEKHPKRVFVKRVMDLEIRLSYFDRIKNTVPGSMLEAGVFPEEAPGPNYVYEDSENPHSAAAASFLRTIRAKAPISETEDELNAFQRALENENNMTPEEAEKVKRDMAVQTVLFVGSRSFSHFLNALERYLNLLRNLSTSPAARQELLTTVAVFWKRHPQFYLIVLDKLLQYRLVDTRDVISWVFAPSEDQPNTRPKTWSDPDLWGMLQITLRSLRKNVDGAKMRVEGLGREAELVGAEEDNKAGGEGVVDAEGDVAVRDATASENPELTSAKAYLQEAQDEQASTLVDVLGHFAKLLPADVSRNDWETWWLEGWVRELCRSAFDRKSISSPAITDGIAKLDLENVSPSVASLVEAAKAWHDFA